MSENLELQKATDAKVVTKALHDMTLGELKSFVKEHGEQIGIEVSRTETFNTKYTAMPRAQIVAYRHERPRRKASRSSSTVPVSSVR